MFLVCQKNGMISMANDAFSATVTTVSFLTQSVQPFLHENAGLPPPFARSAADRMLEIEMLRADHSIIW
jgi:hypothetical protein